jgi:hypothetical protein
VTPYAPQREPERTFPLPHTHLVIQNSPLWTQLYLSSVRVDIPSMQRGAKRTLLVEICRQPTPEETAANLCEALDHIRQSRCSWGDRLG